MSDCDRAPETRRDWDDLGRIDAERAILSEPDKRLGGRDADGFCASGRAEVDPVVGRAEERVLLPSRARALDGG